MQYLYKVTLAKFQVPRTRLKFGERVYHRSVFRHKHIEYPNSINNYPAYSE